MTTPSQARRIAFTRTTITDGKRIFNAATCTRCDEQVHSEGWADATTGIGELNRKISQHRSWHVTWDKERS